MSPPWPTEGSYETLSAFLQEHVFRPGFQEAYRVYLQEVDHWHETVGHLTTITLIPPTTTQETSAYIGTYHFPKDLVVEHHVLDIPSNEQEHCLRIVRRPSWIKNVPTIPSALIREHNKEATARPQPPFENFLETPKQRYPTDPRYKDLCAPREDT